MTQGQVANRANISQPMLSYALNTKKRPGELVAKRLEKITSIPAITWLEGTKAQLDSAWRKFQKQCRLDRLAA